MLIGGERQSPVCLSTIHMFNRNVVHEILLFSVAGRHNSTRPFQTPYHEGGNIRIQSSITAASDEHKVEKRDQL